VSGPDLIDIKGRKEKRCVSVWVLQTNIKTIVVGSGLSTDEITDGGYVIGCKRNRNKFDAIIAALHKNGYDLAEPHNTIVHSSFIDNFY
jgi:hypothetical protein